MSDQQPAPHPPQMPGAPWWYALPQERPVSVGYRRWAGILTWLTVIFAVFVVVALVTSIVFLVVANGDDRKSALGYLAIVLWIGIVAATPVLFALASHSATMRRRVRQQRQAGITPW